MRTECIFPEHSEKPWAYLPRNTGSLKNDTIIHINDIIFYYEDIEDLDGLIPFASDGCGIAFAFDKKSEEIVSIPMDCLERNYAKIIAVNYDDFIDRLCSHKLQY